VVPPFPKGRPVELAARNGGTIYVEARRDAKTPS
jgi:hypothetical protein